MADGVCIGCLRVQASEEPTAVHLLPCCITRTGTARVASFFKPREGGAKITDGVPCQEASFRGKKMFGTTLELPPHSCGLVLQKERKCDELGDSWRSCACFSELTYWNHDTIPTSADPARRCVDWLDLSHQVHQSVSERQVACILQEGIEFKGRLDAFF